jgi:hypothetical protein
MRRIVLLAALLLLIGCQGVVGPRQRFCEPKVIDNPCLSIEEQKARGREYLALPEQSWDVAPRTFAEQPGYHGRY